MFTLLVLLNDCIFQPRKKRCNEVIEKISQIQYRVNNERVNLTKLENFTNDISDIVCLKEDLIKTYKDKIDDILNIKISLIELGEDTDEKKRRLILKIFDKIKEIIKKEKSSVLANEIDEKIEIFIENISDDNLFQNEKSKNEEENDSLKNKPHIIDADEQEVQNEVETQSNSNENKEKNDDLSLNKNFKEQKDKCLFNEDEDCELQNQPVYNTTIENRSNGHLVDIEEEEINEIEDQETKEDLSHDKNNGTFTDKEINEECDTNTSHNRYPEEQKETEEDNTAVIKIEINDNLKTLKTGNSKKNSFKTNKIFIRKIYKKNKKQFLWKNKLKRYLKNKGVKNKIFTNSDFYDQKCLEKRITETQDIENNEENVQNFSQHLNNDEPIVKDEFYKILNGKSNETVDNANKNGVLSRTSLYMDNDLTDKLKKNKEEQDLDYENSISESTIMLNELLHEKNRRNKRPNTPDDVSSVKFFGDSNEDSFENKELDNDEEVEEEDRDCQFNIREGLRFESNKPNGILNNETIDSLCNQSHKNSNQENSSELEFDNAIERKNDLSKDSYKINNVEQNSEDRFCDAISTSDSKSEDFFDINENEMISEDSFYDMVSTINPEHEDVSEINSEEINSENKFHDAVSTFDSKSNDLPEIDDEYNTTKHKSRDKNNFFDPNDKNLKKNRVKSIDDSSEIFFNPDIFEERDNSQVINEFKDNHNSKKESKSLNNEEKSFSHTFDKFKLKSKVLFKKVVSNFNKLKTKTKDNIPKLPKIKKPKLSIPRINLPSINIPPINLPDFPKFKFTKPKIFKFNFSNFITNTCQNTRSKITSSYNYVKNKCNEYFKKEEIEQIKKERIQKSPIKTKPYNNLNSKDSEILKGFQNPTKEYALENANSLFSFSENNGINNGSQEKKIYTLSFEKKEVKQNKNSLNNELFIYLLFWCLVAVLFLILLINIILKI